MTFLHSAKKLASQGFWVFPVIPGGKRPARAGWQEMATRDHELIERYWSRVGYNIGVYTAKFGDAGEALLVVDVDNKHGIDGSAAWRALRLSQLDTMTAIARTPTGGEHWIYRVPAAIRQGVHVLGPGLDIRSAGGYIVGAGSVIPGLGAYEWAVEPRTYSMETTLRVPR